MELSLFARITPKPDYYDDALKALRQVIRPTNEETGCRRFELNVGDGDDPSLYLVEHWASDAALELHYEQPYSKEIFALYENWLAEPPMVIKMRRDL